jgi:pimeloyl-ACP methyl ester carboxylesterase
MNTFSRLQRPDRPQVTPGYPGPRIAAIYGLAAREHMQRHLLRFIREAGYPDTTLYGHLQAALIADDLQQAAAQGRPVVLVGYSQGGLEAMNVAHRLYRRGVPVALMVLIAARGLGRIFPHRWRADMRRVPPNVALCLNYFAEGDRLGSDMPFARNEMIASAPSSRVENIGFAREEGLSHLGIARCYPPERLPAVLKTRLHQRVLAALAS